MTTQEIDNQKFHAGDMVRKKTTGETGEIVKLNTNGKQLMPSYLVKPKEGDSVYWWEHDIEICHECGGYMAKGGSVKDKIQTLEDELYPIQSQMIKLQIKSSNPDISQKERESIEKEIELKNKSLKELILELSKISNKWKREYDRTSYKSKYSVGDTGYWEGMNVEIVDVTNTSYYIRELSEDGSQNPNAGVGGYQKKRFESKFILTKSIMAKGGKISGASRYVKMSICSLKEASKHLEQAISKKHKEVSKGIKDGEYKRKFEKSLHTAKSKLKDIQEAISHKVKFEHGGVMPDCPCMHEKGGELGDNKFSYMMLGRLKSDCDYYLGNGNRSERNLWAKSVEEQIKEMKRIWNSLPENEKPEWLSMEDIEDYESKMKDEYAKGGFMYEIEKKGHVLTPSESYISAKNVEDLKKRIKEKHGSLDGISAKRKGGSGAFYHVNIHEKGGEFTFKQKSNAVAKRLEGEKVPAKYQSEYGKTYSKEEAHEAADKIIGKFVSRTGMRAKGGTIVFKIKGDSDTIENRALLKKALSDKSKQNSVTYKIKVGDNIPSNTKIGDTLLYEILKYKNPSLVIDIVDNGKSIKVVQNNEVRYTPYKI